MKTHHGFDNVERDGNVASALRSLAMHDTREPVAGDQAPFLSAFVTRTRENIARLHLPAAGLVVVLEGRKEIIDGGDNHIYEAGEAFVLPAGACVDVVNEPDPESDFYRALFIRFPRNLVIEAARLWPQFVGKPPTCARPRLSADLCSAILHAGEAFSRSIPVSRRVIEHRILEILLILAEQGVVPLVPKYVDASVAEAVRLLIRHRLHLPWTAAQVAAGLSMSEATLRRRLRAESATLQTLLRAERMRAAYTILADRDADVAEALAATGYRSRSHFARHFRESFGMTPSSARHQTDGAAI